MLITCIMNLVLNTERTLKETEQISHTTHTNSVLHKLKGVSVTWPSELLWRTFGSRKGCTTAWD